VKAGEFMTQDDMLRLKKWAVVGATANKEKYGYKIFKRLLEYGYEVYLVNPNYEQIEGRKCYASVLNLPVVPDVIDMVVAPRHGIKVVEEAAQMGIKNIWLQPGTVSDELLEFANQKGLHTVQGCVLVALNH